MKIKSKFLAVFLFGLMTPFIWSNFSFATVGKPMIVYSEDETASIQSSQFNSSTNSWATAATAATTSRKQYWKVAKTHPKGNKKVVVSVENPTSGDPYLYASLWDESNWDDGTGASFNDVKQLGQVYTNSYRCFDAAYEQTSGKLLVVAASPTANTIKTWTWDGSTWTALSNYTFTSTMASIHWIRLASNPKGGSNEIALIALDSGSKVNVLTWNGSSWGNETNLTSSANTNTQEDIALDYIKAGSSAGYAIALWGQSTRIYYSCWTGSSWSGSSYMDVTGSPYWIRHKSNPYNNFGTTVYEDSSNHIYALGWNGLTAFSATVTIDDTHAAYGNYQYNRPFDLSHISGNTGYSTPTNGNSLIVWGDSVELRYMVCGSSNTAMTCGSESNIRNGATTFNAYWVQMERAADDTIHLAIHDANDKLVTFTYSANWYKNTISTNLEKETNHVHEVFALFNMPAAKALVAWSQNNSADVMFSKYNNDVWGVRQTAYSPSSDYHFWKATKSSSDGTKQVVASMEYTNSTTNIPHLYASIYNGSTWGTTKDFGHVYSDTENRSGSLYYNSRTRVFDAAFETSDGHILVVATDPSYPYQMNYWTYNGTWSSGTLTFNNFNVHTIRWAKLASNPKADSNEISLIVVGDYNGTYALAVAKIWNGSSWGNEQLLSSNLNPTWSNAVEAIAVEYMQAGSEVGKAVFAWADMYSYVYGRVWDGTSGWGSAQSKSAATEVRLVRLKADPASSNMMLGFETWGRYLYAVKWTGTGWESSSPTRIGTLAYGDSNDPIYRPFDVIFESGYGHSGHAVFAYGDSGGNTYYTHYNGSSWGSVTQASNTIAYWVELERANDNTVHLAAHSWSGDFKTLVWDNSSWTTQPYLTAPNTYLQVGDLAGSTSQYPEVFSLTKISTATPEIHGLDYNFGTVGAPITLHGAGFGVTQGSSTVKFYNNQTATVTSWSDVKIVVTVPASMASGYITVTRGSNTDTISFSAITSAPTITAVLPDKGSNFSDIDMAYITGINFSPGATVKLTKVGQPDITATNVAAASSTRIETATLNITSAAAGYWNVVVTNPDTQTVTSTNAFAIYSPNQVATGTNANYADLASPNERHLVRDSNGNWYAVFFSNDSTKIYITKSTDGSTWDSPTALVGTGGIITTTAPFRDVSVDIYRTGNITNDRIHIVWRFATDDDNTKRILYSRCINLASYTSTDSWKQANETTNGLDILDTTIQNLERISYPDIAVDSGGYPHVVWFYGYSSSAFYRIRYITTRPGGTWGSIVNVATENDGDITSGYPSVDTDSNNYVHVSYSQLYTTPYKNIIRYAKSTNYTSFTDKTDIIANSSLNFYQSSLVIDSANKIYVVALDSTGKDLYWAHYNGSTWSTNNNLTNGSFDIESAVVGAKMGSGITDHILLSKVYDASTNKKVIYWRWDSANSNWNKYSEDLDTGNASLTYVTIEKHAPASLKTMGYLFYDASGDSLYFDKFTNLGSEPTVVFLTSFTATGNGKQVKVDWETASEIDNLGFNLYRSTKKDGRYTKLNKRLIPGLLSSPTGKSYTYADKNVIKGKLYYYKLEDIDLSGKRTMHGPICVDWNGDGIPDDQQLKKSPGLSAGGSARRPVMTSRSGNSKLKSPYDPGSRVIAAETKSFTARQKEYRVLLEWRSAYEVNILGYHVYREENGELLRLTPEFVAGSALFAGNALPAGNAYSYWDDLSRRPSSMAGLEDRPIGLEERPFGTRGAASDLKVIASSEAILKRSDPRANEARVPSAQRSVAYWLEEVQLDGTQTWCGPVTPISDETLKLPGQTASSYSPLLSKLGEEDAENQTPFSIGVQSTLQPKTALGSVSAWDLAGMSAVKLSIRERGWYRVTQPELVAAGLDPNVNPLFLQLFVEGEELPMLVQGEEDGRFDPNDSIEFYGEGLDTLFSDTRLYWVIEGVTSGKRIPTVSNRSGLASVEAGFPSTVEIKERSIYFSALRNGEENNFFGPVIGAEPVERTLDLQYLNLSYAGKAVLKVSLQGVTLKPHSVRVFLNGVSIGKVTFTGQEHKVAQMQIPRSRLRKGMNRVRLLAQGGDIDVSLLDTVELTYRHTYTAEEDALLCTVSMGGMHTLKGFSGPLIRVADVTNPSEVKMMPGTVRPQVPSLYKIGVFNAPRSGTHTWFAFSEEAIKTPVEIKANQVSTWHDEGQGADLVIISHGNFKESLAPLKTLRESQGLSVALIDVEDLYDEFSYGTKTPQAIKDFLTRASASWQTPPRFVLLVGDASFDPMNHLGLGSFDFLPTKLLDTAYMETASDDWFVDFNGDGLPDMAMGRLPVQTSEEATTVVSKIIAYDQAAAGDWATEALMVADQNGDFDFEGASQEVSDLLPEAMTVWSVYRGQTDDQTARTAILGSINEGKLLVNYIGHGAVDLWRGNVLTVSDAATLTNGSALPLLVGMTCLSGFFQTPYVESLAEALLKAENGGAVAVWTSSGLTDPAGQSEMNKGLMRLLFNGEGLTLGEATAQAKAATSDQDVRRSWILFGDPTTRLRQ